MGSPKVVGSVGPEDALLAPNGGTIRPHGGYEKRPEGQGPATATGISLTAFHGEGGGECQTTAERLSEAISKELSCPRNIL